jgi:hypothetical protein
MAGHYYIISRRAMHFIFLGVENPTAKPDFPTWHPQEIYFDRNKRIKLYCMLYDRKAKLYAAHLVKR